MLTSAPPPVLGGMYPIEMLWMQPAVISSDPIRAGDATMVDAPPSFSTSTNQLDRYRALFLVLGIVIGAFLFQSR